MGTVANVIVGSATLSVKDPYGGSWAEVGYTEDGVTFEYTADANDTEVNEETVAIGRSITKETGKITCNLAESTLANLSAAMIGADDDTARTIKLGGGVTNYIAIKLVGTSPDASYPIRTITMAKGTATGTVGISYKKGEKNLTPFEFEAVKPDSGDPITIVDSA